MSRQNLGNCQPHAMLILMSARSFPAKHNRFIPFRQDGIKPNNQQPPHQSPPHALMLAVWLMPVIPCHLQRLFDLSYQSLFPKVQPKFVAFFFISPAVLINWRRNNPYQDRIGLALINPCDFFTGKMETIPRIDPKSARNAARDPAKLSVHVKKRRAAGLCYLQYSSFRK